jgi:glycerol-3-phosphate cytidylyltransferase-like family protein
VDQTFYEESLEEKERYVTEYGADILVMGDDWAGKFDHLSHLCEVVYLPRTPAISTTEVIEKIRL